MTEFKGRGDVGPIRRWQKSLNPTQRLKWRKSISEGRERAKQNRLTGQLLANGAKSRRVSINVAERNADGRYLKGSSRTLVLTNCPFDPDGVLERLMPHLRDLKNPVMTTRRSHHVIDLA